MTEFPSAAPPLEGIRIVEFTGLGPGPFAGMMLADMGAEIIRIDRPGSGISPSVGATDPTLDYLARGRRSVALNLKAPGAVDVALRLIKDADGLIEGFRPGVMERLGLGPDVALSCNPRLVYGRMTGWGQTGPVSAAAGHDLNYIALSGALWASGSADGPPAFPLNLLGDFGGGGMFLAYGMLAGFLKAARTGQGDVIDAAICDGMSTLMAMIHSQRAMGKWRDTRQSNSLDGGVPWYGVYECADGGWITIGALEPQFWARLLDLLRLDPAQMGDRSDRSTWAAMRATLSALFLSQSRDHWCALLEGTDACFAPVLSPAEAASHPHNLARGVFAQGPGDQPMPAPRFAHSQTPLPAKPPLPGADSRSVLVDAGFAAEEIAALVQSGAVACATDHSEEDPS
ncbi:CaiB/BaiF CoA transferase family protein [Pseudooceanicola spongiae]|uniref:CaiB/BaiF CoA transferase family protein n=1 Tax=Pseudooceanicola spongiae TaxID=2613965 RepID=UPI001D00F975|nr:CaiB/BaiF CoA-transferase family protein [Pseudooceanicola spongiae]